MSNEELTSTICSVKSAITVVSLVFIIKYNRKTVHYMKEVVVGESSWNGRRGEQGPRTECGVLPKLFHIK